MLQWNFSAALVCSEILTTDLQKSVTADFEFRDNLPQTLDSVTHWQPEWGPWGPRSASYPKPLIPQDYSKLVWAQNRLRAVAEKYIGLSYKHKHIPALGGLDCSNFTSWVYNYGLGIKFTSHVERQAYTVGRRLEVGEPFQTGDLLFQWKTDRSRISHVVMWLGNDLVIDSSTGGVQVRRWEGWRKANFAWASRVLETGPFNFR